MFHVLWSDTVIISASNMVGVTLQRLFKRICICTQNTIDVEGNYRKWVTEYKSQSNDDSLDYAELANEEVDA